MQECSKLSPVEILAGITTILSSNEVVLKDKLILIILLAYQGAGVLVKFDEIGPLVGMGGENVRKRLRRLRERDILRNRRLGKYGTVYDLSYFIEIPIDWSYKYKELKEKNIVDLPRGEVEKKSNSNNLQDRETKSTNNIDDIVDREEVISQTNSEQEKAKDIDILENSPSKKLNDSHALDEAKNQVKPLLNEISVETENSGLDNSAVISNSYDGEKLISLNNIILINLFNLLGGIRRDLNLNSNFKNNNKVKDQFDIEIETNKQISSKVNNPIDIKINNMFRELINTNEDIKINRMFLPISSTGNISEKLEWFIDFVSRLIKFHSPREGVEMAQVSGPESYLRQSIESEINKQKSRERKEELARKIVIPPRIRRTEDKEVANYNVNDLENTFRNLWQEHKFIGNPFRWTAKERKFCKEILKAEGPEAVVTLFRYIFENWNDVKERYDLGGAPSMQLMYAYRRTFMFDALLGAPQKRKHGGDYSGDADMGESGWGDD